MTAIQPHDTVIAVGDLSLWTRTEGDAVVVTARGEIDMATAPALADLLRNLAADGYRKVIVAMSGVTFIDSSGLQVLIAARKAGHDRSALRLVGVAGGAKRLLEITGLTTVLPVWGTVEDAIAFD